MTTWFTADLHLGHANIIRYCGRPFESVEEMNAEICRRWRATVAEEDTVWVLGDAVLGDLQSGLSLIEELPGQLKYLVLGNHDRPWRGNDMSIAQRTAWVSRYQTAFTRVLNGPCALRVGDYKVQLSHFPYNRDLLFRRSLDEYRPEDLGAWLLHGHAHGGLGPVHGRQIDVGVDCWDFTPVSEGQILEILK